MYRYAVFTGGDRVDTCVAANTTVDGGCTSHIMHMLQNNAGGRFRVASNVIVPAAATTVLKRSPEISVPAIIPVALPTTVGLALCTTLCCNRNTNVMTARPVCSMSPNQSDTWE